MQFKELGNLFNFDESHGIYEIFAGTFKGYSSLDDMQNIHKDLLNKEFKISTKGISEFTTANIQAKAATMGLADSLTTELIAMGKDATFTQKAATGKLTWGKALKDAGDDLEDIGRLLSKNENLSKETRDSLSNILDSGKTAKYKQAILDALNSVDGLSDAIIDIGSATTQAAGPLSGLQQTFTGIVASVKQMLPVLAIVGTAIAAYEGFKWLDDKYTLTFDTAQKHLEESSASYATTLSELDNLNSKTEEYRSTLESIGSKYKIEFSGTETIDEMINNIRSIDGKVNVVDEASINKIERENSLLKTQKELLSTTATEQQKQAAEDARKSIDFLSERIYSKDSNVGKSYHGMPFARMVNRDDYVRNQIAEMERAKKQIEEAQEKLADDSISKKERQSYEDQFERATENLEKYRQNASEKLMELNAEAENFYDKETGLVLKGFEEDAQKIKSVNDLFNSFDLSSEEKSLKQIESFFNGSKISNNLKDSIKEMLKTGEVESATDALHKLGITLNDLGLTEKGFKKSTFDDYFNGLIDSANEAKEAINSIDGSVSGVKEAFESENKDADWNSMAEFLKQADEIYEKTGKVGTDDFKSAAQFMFPDVINPDAEGFKFDSDAYVAAWEAMREKAKRYFDSENPIASATNFTNDLIDKGLATKVGDEITWQFKNSAEAADALGISVQAAEVSMHNLEAYGAEFDDVMFSGEGIARYEDALNGIKSIYDSMENGDSKKQLGNLIEGWDKEFAGYQADLSTLNEEQIVKIEFQYDLQSIKAEIESLQNDIKTTGGDTKEWGSLNSRKLALRDKLSSQDGVGSINDSGYQNSLETANKLSEKLVSEFETLGEEGRREIQIQQSALLDLQSSFLEQFSNDKNIDWESFLNSDQATEILEGISESSGMTVEDLENLLSISEVQSQIKVEAELDTSQIESKLEGLEAGSTIQFSANVDDIATTITALKNEDGTITYTADIGGVQQAVNVVENEDGTITYTTNIDGVEQELSAVKNEDGTITYTVTGIQGAEIPNGTQVVNQEQGAQVPLTAPDAKQIVNQELGKEVPTTAPDATQRVNRIVGNDVDYTLPAATQLVNRTVVETVEQKASGTMLSPAHADGTAYNMLNLKPAHAGGNVGLPRDEDALVNELGTESIIRDGVWSLLPGKMHIQALKKGDIILNAKQTADLLDHGKTNSHARAYADGTLGHAYANGWRLPTAVSNNTSNTNTSSTVSSAQSIAKSTSDAADSAKEFDETLDWIETKIERIERQIKNLERTAGSAYNTFEKRNSALRDQMGSITEEISIQQAGYQRYLQEANSVPLDENYKSLVRSGAIDISTITDEELSKNIKKFQEWWISRHTA